MLLSLCELSRSPERGCYFAGLRVSFVPNLEACRCLLLIFDASFDILFTFIADMWRKHLYQSVSCMPGVVRMSGLPYSLHFWGVDAAARLPDEPTESDLHLTGKKKKKIDLKKKISSF